LALITIACRFDNNGTPSDQISKTNRRLQRRQEKSQSRNAEPRVCLRPWGLLERSN